MSNVELPKLPERWVCAQLDSICEINPRTWDAPSTTDEMISFVPMAAVEPGTGVLDPSRERPWGELERKSYTKFYEGDILFAKVTPCMENGKIAVASGLRNAKGVGSTEFHVLRPSKGILSHYLLHYLLQPSFRAAAERSMSGAVGLRRVPTSFLKEHLIPLPPLAEQYRIVEALEDHLSRLDAAKASLALSSRRSTRLMQRLIVDAVDVDAATSHETSLGSVARSVKNGIFVSRPGTEPSGIPILRIGAVRALKLDTHDIRYTGLKDDSKEVKGHLLDAGDLLFTRYNGNPEYVGACAVVPHTSTQLTYPDKLIRVIVDRTKAIPEYVALACTAGNARQYIRQSIKTTAGQAGISGRELKGVPLWLPSLEEQARRVQEYQSVEAAVGLPHQVIDRARFRSSHLRQAILRRAFSGKLVPQDPNDEPASLLLDGIREERATQGGKPKRPRAPRRRRAATTPAADMPPPPPPAAAPSPTYAVQQELPL